MAWSQLGRVTARELERIRVSMRSISELAGIRAGLSRAARGGDQPMALRVGDLVVQYRIDEAARRVSVLAVDRPEAGARAV